MTNQMPILSLVSCSLKALPAQFPIRFLVNIPWMLEPPEAPDTDIRCGPPIEGDSYICAGRNTGAKSLGYPYDG